MGSPQQRISPSKESRSRPIRNSKTQENQDLPTAFLQNRILARVKSQRQINRFRILHGRLVRTIHRVDTLGVYRDVRRQTRQTRWYSERKIRELRTEDAHTRQGPGPAESARKCFRAQAEISIDRRLLVIILETRKRSVLEAIELVGRLSLVGNHVRVTRTWMRP